jgi:hypothetical protein
MSPKTSAMCVAYPNRPLSATIPEGRMPAPTGSPLFGLRKKTEKAKNLQILKESHQAGLSDVKNNTDCLKMLKIELFEELIRTSVLSLN